jgi:beta-xylosidase
MKIPLLIAVCLLAPLAALHAAEPPAIPAQTQTAPINNPLNKGRGPTFDDPHGMVHNGRVYLFACHDFSPESKYYTLKDWWVWSSSDLINWKLESVLKPEDTFIGRPSDKCWATFGVERGGKWYWYFSDGPEQIGVVTADSPAGPWKDPLKAPLIPKGMYDTNARDPDILMDDDGKAYMVFGAHKYFIVRLGEDMISLAEPARRLAIKNSFGPFGSGLTDDKPSLHKRNGLYYLSWSSFYAVSTNVYGPYEYKGTVIDPARVAPEFLRQRGRLFLDRHGNFFEYNNQWYYVANDFSQPGRNMYYRDSIMAYVHYKDNGEMAPIRIDSIGVGQYDANCPQIEAEDYFKAVQAEKRECPLGGFEMRLSAGSQLYYPNIHNVPAKATLSLSLATENTEGVIIEVREGTPEGPLLGTCRLGKTGKWDKYGTFSCQLNNKEGALNLCLLVTGNKEAVGRLDWLAFAPPKN